jgi:hypothetical protein
MPEKDTKEAKTQANAVAINASAAMIIKTEAVVDSQKQ